VLTVAEVLHTQYTSLLPTLYKVHNNIMMRDKPAEHSFNMLLQVSILTRAATL
jgi:hypothetical protein